MELRTFGLLVFGGVALLMLGGPIAAAFAVVIGFGITYVWQWRADRNAGAGSWRSDGTNLPGDHRDAVFGLLDEGDGMMSGPPVPQRMTFVTLGTRDMRRARSFYAAWGWQERSGGSDEFAQFAMGGVRLALYPLALLGHEAAPDAASPSGEWNGVTLAINVESRQAVDHVYRAVTNAGAEPITEPVDREWGGYSAYVADPEGQRWEIAWAPGFDFSA